jgi:hypothetical protein
MRGNGGRRTRTKLKPSIKHIGNERPGKRPTSERKKIMEQIKAIQTEYNGYKFRSRLEARWAVFFDAAGIKYEYEPEGFENEGIKWLPDFYLPETNTYVEVKPERDNAGEELEKPFHFVFMGIIQRLLILPNIPEEIDIPIWWFPFAFYHPGKRTGEIARATFVPNGDNTAILETSMYVGYRKTLCFWVVNDFLKTLIKHGLLRPVHDYQMPYEKDSRICEGFLLRDSSFFPYCESLDTVDLDFMRNCYGKARKARFEYGKKG